MTEVRNARWKITVNPDGTVPQADANLAVLMDIRDVLQRIDSKLGCYRIPRALDAIERMDRLGIKRRIVRERKGRK